MGNLAFLCPTTQWDTSQASCSPCLSHSLFYKLLMQNPTVQSLIIQLARRRTNYLFGAPRYGLSASVCSQIHLLLFEKCSIFECMHNYVYRCVCVFTCGCVRTCESHQTVVLFDISFLSPHVLRVWANTFAWMGCSLSKRGKSGLDLNVSDSRGVTGMFWSLLRYPACTVLTS